MSSWKTVVHSHTDYSHDSNVSWERLLATARHQGVDCVAITDHDQVEGALRARQAGDVRVIVGEEISSADGHIIGLFLEERVQPGLSLEETAGRIRQQGGLVLAPHPLATLCEDSLRATNLARLLPWLDAVEVGNAQNVFTWEDRKAAGFAREHGIAPYVGADAHIRGYLAGCYQMMAEFDGPGGFMESLRSAELHAGLFGLGYFVAMGGRHLWDMFSRRRLRGFGVNAPEGPHARATCAR